MTIEEYMGALVDCLRDEWELAWAENLSHMLAVGFKLGMSAEDGMALIREQVAEHSTTWRSP